MFFTLIVITVYHYHFIFYHYVYHNFKIFIHIVLIHTITKNGGYLQPFTMVQIKNVPKNIEEICSIIGAFWSRKSSIIHLISESQVFDSLKSICPILFDKTARNLSGSKYDRTMGVRLRLVSLSLFIEKFECYRLLYTYILFSQSDFLAKLRFADSTFYEIYK